MKNNPSTLFGRHTRAISSPARMKGVVGGDARDDLAAFWLRKTKKPVLAVLLVQKRGGKPQLYRGTNMEVRTATNQLVFEATLSEGCQARQKGKIRAYIRVCPLSSAIPPPSTVRIRLLERPHPHRVRSRGTRQAILGL